MPARLVRAAPCAAFFVLCACPPATPEWVERPTQASWDPASDDFWARPIPSDLRLQDDGTWDIERWPGPWDNDLITMWLRAFDKKVVGGWGLSAGVFLPLSGPIDDSTLPASPDASRATDSPVFLVDISPESPEYGKRFPARVRTITEVDLYTPENLLGVLPVFGHVRRPLTTYAVVVTDAVLDAGGEPLGQSRPFYDALFETEGADARAAEHLAPLRAWLADESQSPPAKEHVAAAAVFTTFDPHRDLKKLAAWYEQLPAPALSSPWTVAEEYESYQVLTATYEVPLYQTGQRPYGDLGEGLIVWGDDGNPVIQETQDVRLALTIPKAPMPAAGFPLILYLHGSGGEYYQAINRGPVAELPPEERSPPVAGRGPAEWAARRGLATVAFDFPLHGDRNDPPDTSGLLLYNLFGNIEATLDNFNVAAAEVTYLSRLMVSTTVDPTLADTLDAGASADGLIRFDETRLTAFGQSMGTTLGVAWATVDPRVDGVLFSGAGGILVEIAVEALEPFAFKGTLETLVQLEDDQDLHVDHPMLHTLQHVWDFVDPVAKARHVAAEPHPGFRAKQVMMTAGVRDGYFAPASQAAIAGGLGATLVGDPVEPTLPEVLSLAGREPVGFPQTGTADRPLISVVQYEAPYTLGHYVVFNQDGARHTWTCFLASVSEDGATLSAGAGLEDPCP